MKIRSNRRKRRRYGRGRSDRKVFYARAGLAALLLLTIVLILRSCISKKQGEMRADVDASRPEIDVQLLDINEYSRPGIESDGITGIVIHYTANPGSTAQENRDYFEGLKDTHETSASSNFVVGLEGEIVQCIPTAEIAYASNDRNSDTISIECCYKNEDGSFEQATYDSVIKLTAWLCAKFGLTSEDVIRHYDVTGKLCPLYYVEHEDAWAQFKKDVDTYLQVYKTGDENG